MKYLFLDTNVYLHCKDVEEIDWKSLVTGGEDFTIVIPPVVIREIDKIKDRERGKVQARAKKVSSRFGDIFLEGKKMKLKYKNCEDPTNDLFEKYKFNKDVFDDWFILSAKIFPESDNVVVIARDNGILMKAKDNGFTFFRISDDFLLKVEKSEEEKEIQRLKEELEVYKNRKPNPQITFEDRSTILKLKKPTPKDLEVEIEKYLEKEKLKYPYHTFSETDNYLGITLSSIWENEYNKQREEYFGEYKEYIPFIVQNEILSERMKELKFVVSNFLGTAPTGDMNIFINIPANIKLYSKRSKIRRIRNVPIPPQKNGLDRKLLQATANIQPLGSYLQGPDYEYCWDLSKTLASNEFSFDESKLNHTLYKNLNVENSIFIDTLSCGNFSIDWYVSDSALPKPISGKLNVIIEE